jgi:hypothetical protein
LDLLAHLLDGNLKLDRRKGRFGGDRFGRQCIGLTVELLHEKVETTTHWTLRREAPPDLPDVGINAIDLFSDIGFAGEQNDFLV